MERKEEVRDLRARAQALETRLHWLERRIRKIEPRPSSSFFKAIVDPEKCQGCGLCEVSCSAGAIVIQGIARINPERCVGCGHCVEICPQGAISLRAEGFSHRRQAGSLL